MSLSRPGSKFRVAIAGAGVAALETALALADLAPKLTDVTLIAPNDRFVYRPMTVREPFSYAKADSYELAPIVHDAGATMIEDELARIDPVSRALHTRSEQALEYDALVLALGARATVHYAHAVTIEDRHLESSCTASSRMSRPPTSADSRSSLRRGWRGHCPCTSSP